MPQEIGIDLSAFESVLKEEEDKPFDREEIEMKSLDDLNQLNNFEN